MAAIKPDYIVLAPEDLQPSPETTDADAERFIAAVEAVTGVPVKRLGEISTGGPGGDTGPVVLRGGLYHVLADEWDEWDDDRDYANLPDDWYQKSWVRAINQTGDDA